MSNPFACGHKHEAIGAVACPICGCGVRLINKGSHEPKLTGVFVSYSRIDAYKATALVAGLESRGVRVWYDNGEIRGGENFEFYIYNALQTCARVIVLWSESSVNSSWVLKEASFGLRNQKLLPARLDGVELPQGFEHLHTIDLSSWNGTEGCPEFKRLLKDVKFFISLTG